MKKLYVIMVAAAMLTYACKKDNKNEEDPNCATCAYTYAATDIKATVDAANVGTFQTTMQFAAAASPFPNGTKATFTLLANGDLKANIDGKGCVTLKNPTAYSATAKGVYVYKDSCKFNLEFEISFSQTGQFNEVNIAKIGTTTFLGQFGK